MPHASFKIIPGVDVTKTPALNEGAVSQSQLIRFQPDRTLGGIIQKLGGWAKYYANNIGSIARCLWAWEDTNNNSYLGIGAEGVAPIVVTGASGNGTTVTLTYTGPFTFSAGNSITVSGITPSGYNGTYQITSSTSTSVSYSSTFTTAYVSGGLIAGGGESLQIIKNGTTLTDITPQLSTYDVAVSFSTVSGSNVVTITHASSNIDNYDSVYIKTQVSVGGLILFGLYKCTALSSSTYSIQAVDALGNPANATSTVTNGGAVSLYNVTNNSPTIQVTLNNHGLLAGDTYPVLVSTTVGGIPIYGNYQVLFTPAPTTNSFYITGANKATSTTSGYENGGNVRFTYYNGIGPVAAGTGYGIGGYGSGGYGSGLAIVTSNSGVPINATDWTLDNWGEVLIANPLDGAIYYWSPTENNPIAVVIPNAPPVNEGVFVAMPQRQIIAWGSTFTGIVDPLLIRWCDVDDFNSWISLPTNQAGSYRIPKGSKIVQCIQGPQQGLVWTDLGVWAMQYIGPQYVYSFNELGNGCGLIGRKAAASLNGITYWMGPNQFYKLAGSGVEPIRCPIWDVIFQELDTNNLDKIRIACNSRFGEVTWYFPTTSTGEVNGYAKYNILLDQWDYGFNSTANPYVARTAWINDSVLGPPIGAAANKYIYQHEISQNADGAAMDSYFQTGYMAMTEADVKIFVDQIWPDMKWGYYGGAQSAQVNMSFYVADYPGDTPTVYGPYTMTQTSPQFITPRFRGRLVSIRIESNDINSWWRLGNIRYRQQIDGKY